MTSTLPTPAGSGYQPEADLVWEIGRQGELFALDLAKGLEDGSVEVKNEHRARDRVFIEYACQWSDGEWHNSGIRTTGAQTWLIVLADAIGVAVPVHILKEMVERMVSNGQRAKAYPPNDWGLVEKPFGGDDRWPTKGAVIPFRTFIPWVLQLAKHA